MTTTKQEKEEKGGIITIDFTSIKSIQDGLEKAASAGDLNTIKQYMITQAVHR
jgi:hypothetical protein